MGLFDDERLKNFILYKFYGTDKELEEAMPFLGVVVIVAVVIFVIICIVI